MQTAPTQSDPETKAMSPRQAGAMRKSSPCAMDIQAGDSEVSGPLQRYDHVNLHGVDVFHVVGVGRRSALRTYRHIHADSNRDYLLIAPLASRTFTLQNGRQTYCESGMFCVHSAATPFSATALGRSSDNVYSHLIARVSAPLLRHEVPDIDRRTNICARSQTGASRIMRSLLELAVKEGRGLSAYQAQDFGKTVAHAVAVALLDLPELEPDKTPRPLSSHERIVESARCFIEQNLSDPLLDCAMVAAHCQISATYLHVAFAARALKVGAYIRESRLRGCRADLRNPSLHRLSVADIAMRWGFGDAASFSRAYKTHFGRTPREERGGMSFG